MNKKLVLIFLVTISSTTLYAESLKENISEVLHQNPTIQENLRNFRIAQQDLSIAESEFYPIIDFNAQASYNDAGNLNNKVNDIEYNNYESSITFTQNLFDGFGDIHKIDYEEARVLSAAYKYMEVSNDMAFKMTSAYINVLKESELLQTARENVQVNEVIQKKVKDLFIAGLTTDSEVKKIEASLSLARSNLTVQINNALDKEYFFKKILGRMPDKSKMIKPTLDINMPSSMERASLYSISNNPSILVSNYNIKSSQSLMKERKKAYYPKLDFVLNQTYNESSPTTNGFDTPDDRFQAKFVLTYNLYRGGSDKATIQKQISLINKEVDIKRNLKRKVIEDLELSWNSYSMIEAQLKDLKDYNKFSEETLSLYKDEFYLGRRTLLELLTAQNDAINSRSQIITAEYDALFARYRILDAMGLLVLAVNGSTKEFMNKVNLDRQNSQSKIILDTLSIRLDIDNDNITDNLDLCDNSKKDNIMPYGCIKQKNDNDKDGVFDIYDKCPLSKKDEKVNSYGCALELIIENKNINANNISLDIENRNLPIEEILLDEKSFLNKGNKQ